MTGGVVSAAKKKKLILKERFIYARQSKIALELCLDSLHAPRNTGGKQAPWKLELFGTKYYPVGVCFISS